MTENNGKSRSRRFLLVFVIVTAFMVFWFSGLAGNLLAYHLLPMILPLKLGGAGEIRALRLDSQMRGCANGLRLELSTAHVQNMIRGALPGTWWMLPRGLIRDKVLLEGVWMPQGVKMPDTDGIPVYLAIDDSVGPHPRLVGKYKVEALNDILKDEEAFNLKQTDEWALGKYETLYRIIFDSISIISDDEVSAVPIEKRVINFDAKGRVKMKISQGAMKASATAEVDEFKGAFDVKIARDDRGLIFSYDATVDTLKGDIHNLAPWGDDTISQTLKRSLAKSLNRQKKKDRLANDRFPSWLPVDLLVDVKIVTDNINTVQR